MRARAHARARAVRTAAMYFCPTSLTSAMSPMARSYADETLLLRGYCIVFVAGSTSMIAVCVDELNSSAVAWYAKRPHVVVRSGVHEIPIGCTPAVPLKLMPSLPTCCACCCCCGVAGGAWNACPPANVPAA